MNESGDDLAVLKAKRLSLLLGLFLFTFTSPFRASGCAPDFAIGFPLPYIITDGATTRFVPALLLDAVVVYFIFWLFRRYFVTKLVGSTLFASGFRTALYYGLYSTAMCFVFMFLFSQSSSVPAVLDAVLKFLFVLIIPAQFFYPTMFMDREINWAPAEEIILARLLLAPTFLGYVYLFGWLAEKGLRLLANVRSRAGHGGDSA